MGSVEAFLLIVSSTIALFWLAVRSENKRSLRENESAGSVANANPGLLPGHAEREEARAQIRARKLRRLLSD